MATREELIEVLKTILDPELYLDIWTLGLIYDLKIEGPRLDVLMTFTSPACPAGPYLVQEIKEKTKGVGGIEQTEVEITFTPAWEPSEELKQLLGLI